MGTPGRVLDLSRKGILDFKNLKFFVLDECDQMLLKLGKRKYKRHATGGLGHFQEDSLGQAGDDVQCHYALGGEEDL